MPLLRGCCWGPGQKKIQRTRVRVGCCSLHYGIQPGQCIHSLPGPAWADLPVTLVRNRWGTIPRWFMILWFHLQPWHPGLCTNTKESHAQRTHSLRRQTKEVTTGSPEQSSWGGYTGMRHKPGCPGVAGWCQNCSCCAVLSPSEGTPSQIWWHTVVTHRLGQIRKSSFQSAKASHQVLLAQGRHNSRLPWAPVQPDSHLQPTLWLPAIAACGVFLQLHELWTIFKEE